MNNSFDDIKKEFPIFDNNPELVYLDNAATTQKPRAVLQAINKYYEEFNSNVHRGIYDISEKATAAYEAARAEVSNFINGASGHTIFNSGTTDGINMLSMLLEGQVSEGDYIVTTEVEHHSNMLPWMRLAEKSGAKLKFIDVAADGAIKIEEFEKVLKDVPAKKLKVFAFTHVSNVTGLISPVKELAGVAKKHSPGALVIVDGAQAVGHLPVDVAELGVDFYAFSGHKMYGPMGIGALWGKKEVLDTLEPVKTGGGMIQSVSFSYKDVEWASGVEKWEAGTPNVEGAIGLSVAANLLKGLGMDSVAAHEKALLKAIFENLKSNTDIKIIGEESTENRIGLVALYSQKFHPHDIAQIVASNGVAVRAGHHCVQPFHAKLGINGTIRISTGIYNSTQDIEKATLALGRVGEVLV